MCAARNTLDFYAGPGFSVDTNPAQSAAAFFKIASTSIVQAGTAPAQIADASLDEGCWQSHGRPPQPGKVLRTCLQSSISHFAYAIILVPHLRQTYFPGRKKLFPGIANAYKETTQHTQHGAYNLWTLNRRQNNAEQVSTCKIGSDVRIEKTISKVWLMASTLHH